MKRRAVVAGAVLLALLHQDFWLWNDGRLVFGFLPIGLAYHMLISIAAAGLWALAIAWAWPDWVDHVVEATSDEKGNDSSQ